MQQRNATEIPQPKASGNACGHGMSVGSLTSLSQSRLQVCSSGLISAKLMNVELARSASSTGLEPRGQVPRKQMSAGGRLSPTSQHDPE